MGENLSKSILLQFPQYTHNIGFYHFIPYQVLIDLILAEFLKRDLIALDAGCGKNPVLPAAIKGVAVDISLESLKMVKRQRREIQCICASLHYLPFRQASIDLIVSRDVLEHCDSRLFLKEVGRVLKKHGVFIASTSNVFSPYLLLDKVLGRIADRIALKVARTQYVTRTKHLNPYGLKAELAIAGLVTRSLLMVTTPPFLTGHNYREFIKRVPWKLVPWLFLSVGLAHFRIFRETIVVTAVKGTADIK